MCGEVFLNHLGLRGYKLLIEGCNRFQPYRACTERLRTGSPEGTERDNDHRNLQGGGHAHSEHVENSMWDKAF
jgi:hypothetical protein